jgi:hypothetical protein
LASLAVSAGVARQSWIIKDIIFPTEIIESSTILNYGVAFLRIKIGGIVVIEIRGEQEHHQHRHIQSHLQSKRKEEGRNRVEETRGGVEGDKPPRMWRCVCLDNRLWIDSRSGTDRVQHTQLKGEESREKGSKRRDERSDLRSWK